MKATMRMKMIRHQIKTRFLNLNEGWQVGAVGNIRNEGWDIQHQELSEQ